MFLVETEEVISILFLDCLKLYNSLYYMMFNKKRAEALLFILFRIRKSSSRRMSDRE